ncbi:AGE family epimerase/isomerase [Roseospira navarrensis]|uniref:N-acyl-D-glucosamine 2-epimerase n=1 Tax=Roseospira navarrensis TaxID=140058 RepID=A0A7X1ZFE2_9PROT|nr:AGE family epimerase/isomerase [Roseospira navarrensis]MQX37558.1 hypothetical protein [Roseospira navarrensis]
MQGYYQRTTMAGVVIDVDPPNATFSVSLRTGHTLPVRVNDTCVFSVMTNLDGVNRDSMPTPTNAPKDEAPDSVPGRIRKYVLSNTYVVVEGTYMDHNHTTLFAAQKINIITSQPGRVLFEETHWWLSQISQMANRWLDNLFDHRRSYTIDDFSQFYRTNLNIQGMPTDNSIQECATLARLIYGLASAYLLTGNERYFLAARAGVAYQREAFRQVSHDGKYVFWAYGRQRHADGSVTLLVPSQNGDDFNTIPLYEQIYALAGLTQYFRITLDWEVLDDIRRTIGTFQAFFHDGQDDPDRDPPFPGLGGYFSHIDPGTMRPDSIQLGDKKNQSRKNWNSIGDHIPAYLITLIQALEPLGGDASEAVKSLLETCRAILLETTDLIVTKFPDPTCPYVNERFHADWTPDHDWEWQQNRAVVGHNLKIAWNLGRVANYYKAREKRHRGLRETAEAQDFGRRANEALTLARKLGDDMIRVGLDRTRPGVYDCVERKPANGMPIQFTWGTHKDFWQQEQGILAYLILHHHFPEEGRYYREAHDLMAFWNLYFLDRERQGIFFRTDDTGMPIIEGTFADKGGHSISGYHAFELNFLAHLYIRSYLIPKEARGRDTTFCLYFRLDKSNGVRSLNVLPDFFPPGKLRITEVRVNGVSTPGLVPDAADEFQISIKNGMEGAQIAVVFRALP